MPKTKRKKKRKTRNGWRWMRSLISKKKEKRFAVFTRKGAQEEAKGRMHCSRRAAEAHLHRVVSKLV